MNGNVQNCMSILKKLYRIQSKSGLEDKMIAYLTKLIPTLAPECHLEVIDKNIYVTKGVAETYPCIACHIDQVQAVCDSIQIFEQEDIIFGFDFKSRKQVGLGADDKNGIYMALLALINTSVLKAIFFHGEETGCNGSKACNMTFFNDCRFVIECDRKGNSDFVTNGSGVELCSKEFETDCNLEQYGYKACNAFVTDVVALKKRDLPVSCVNISVGYENQHKDNETTCVSDLEKCWELVQHILTLQKTYPHKYVPVATTTPSYSSYWNLGSGYYQGKGKIKQGVLFPPTSINPYRTSKPKVAPTLVISIKEQRRNMETVIDDYILHKDTISLRDLWLENKTNFPDLSFFEFELAYHNKLA